jgi:CheY-like chemotaxis protein
VLVIDDETAGRSIIVDVRNNGGYYVIEAADVPSDLKMLQSDLRIDLLITDVGSPGEINAVRSQMLVEWAVANSRYCSSRVCGNTVIGNGLLEHAMHVITKPFGIQAIANMVCEMIDEGVRLS